MKNKELQMQLQGLLSLGLTEDSPEFIRLKAICDELDAIPKRNWNKQSTVDKIKAIDSLVIDES